MPNQLVTHYRNAYPNESQNLSDDDITLLYASKAPEFKANGVDLFSAYQDFNEDYARIKNSQVQDSITVGDRVKQAAGSAASGLVGGVVGFGALPAIYAKKVTGGLVDPTDEVRDAKKWVNEKFTPEFDGDTEKQAALRGSFLNTDVPNALGSIGSFWVGGGALGAVAKASGVASGAASSTGVALAGFSGSFGDGYEEALAKGANESQAFQAALISGPVGLSEAVPLGKMLDRILRISPIGGKSFIAKLAKTTAGKAAGDITTETLEEAIQEAFQSGAGDVIARDIAAYDPERKMFSNIGQDAATGAAAGFLMSLLSHGISRMGKKAEGLGEGKQAPGALKPNDTLNTGKQDQTPEDQAASVASDIYDIDTKGVNDLVQATLDQGADAVAGEVASLSSDALRLYTIKLNAALRENAANAAKPAAAATPTPLSPEEEAKRAAENAEIQAAGERMQAAHDAANAAKETPVETAPAPAPVEQTTPPVSDATVPPPTEAAPAPAAEAQPVVAPPAPPVVEDAKAKREAEIKAKAEAEKKAVQDTRDKATTISDSVAKFMVENTGEDSVKHVGTQVGEVAKTVSALQSVYKTLSLAKQRVDSGKTEILTKDEANTLAELDGDNISALKLKVFIEKVSANKATAADLKKVLNLSGSLYDTANKKLLKVKDRGGLLAEGNPIQWDALVNPESIDFIQSADSQGYIEANDGTPIGDNLGSMVDSWRHSATLEEKSRAANEIGALLVKGSRHKTSRGVTKRLSAWHAPNGSVVILSSYDYSSVESTGKSVSPNGKYKFSIGPINSKFKNQKGKDIELGNVGIETLLNSGFKPIATMSMVAPRGRVAVTVPSLQAYQEYIGNEAKQVQASVRSYISEFESSGSVDIPTKAEGSDFVNLAEEAAKKDEIGKVSSDEGGDSGEDGGEFDTRRVMLEMSDIFVEIAGYYDQHPVATPKEVMGVFGPKFWTRANDLGLSLEQTGDLQHDVESAIVSLSSNKNRKRVFDEAAAQYSRGGKTDSGSVPEVSGGGAKSDGGGGGGSPGNQQSQESRREEASSSPSAAGGATAAKDPAAVGADLTPAQQDHLAERKSQLVGKIRELVDGGVIPREEAEEGYIPDIIDADTVEDAELNFQTAIDIHTAELDAKKQNSSDSEDGNPNVDSSGEQSYRLLPDSPEAVRFNLRQLLPRPKPPVSTVGITGVVSGEQIQRDYPNLPDALKRIQSIEQASYPATPGNRSPLSMLAEAMASNVSLTGAVLRIENDPNLMANVVGKDGTVKTVPFVGRYNLATDEIVINLANVRDLADLHNVILEETGHAFLDRIDLRFDTDPTTLSQEEYKAIEDLRKIAEYAKTKGLTWQQSDSTNPRQSYREFYQAALTNADFQSQLAKIEDPFSRSTTPESLWKKFKSALSNLYASAIKLIGLPGVSTSEPASGSLLESARSLTDFLISNYNESTAFADSVVGSKLGRSNSGDLSKQAVSYRIVDQVIGKGTDISVDQANKDLAKTEANVMMATTNTVDDAFRAMINAWSRVGSKAPATTTEFAKSVLSRMFRGGVVSPESVRSSINEALLKQNGNSVPTTTSLSDLDQRGEAPKAAKDALTILKRLEEQLRRQNAIAERLFGKGKLNQKIADSNTDLFELTKGYEDITVIQKAFLKSVREAIKEKGDVGVYSVGKSLGLTRSQIDSAAASIQGNIQSHTDALDGLSATGLDFSLMKSGGLTAAQVESAVAASSDPRIAPFKADKAKLAVAINFARKRPMVMDLMNVRRSNTERTAMNKIIEMAVQNKDDAFDTAHKELGKLTMLGRVGERILARLKEHKERNKKLIELGRTSAESMELYMTSASALSSQIAKLEKFLRVEGAARNSSSQWNAVHGAEYYVPQSKTDTEQDLFHDPKRRSVLKLGEAFNAVQVKRDIWAMRDWLENNKSLAGSANYELLKRQADKLNWVYANGANYQIQRGPSGLIVQFLGDIATQSEWTGTQAGRVFAQQIRKYNTLYDSHLKGPEQREFYIFDRLKREAMDATGVYGLDFDRRFYNQAFNFLEHRKDLVDPKLTDEQQVNVSVKAAVDYLESVDPAMTNPAVSKAVADMLRQAVKNNNVTQKNRQSMGLKVREKIIGRWIFREPIGSPPHTMSRSVGWEIRSLVRTKMATDIAWESMIANDKKSLNAGLVTELYNKKDPLLTTALANRFTPEIVEKFVRPLVEKVGDSNFNAPANVDGVVDRAQSENVLEAFRLSGGDMVRFAELLHALEGGAPSTLGVFVGETLATFQKYYSIIKNVSDALPENNESLEESAVVSRSFLDAREGEDFPHQWLDYRQFGHSDNVRYTRMFALQAAYGQDAGGAAANLNKMMAELTDLEAEYRTAMAETDPGIRAAMLNAGGLRRARMDAAKNKVLALRIKENFRDLVSTMNGVPVEEGVFTKMTGMLAGYTVQGGMTAFMDTISMVESIYRKFGFSKEALSFIAGNFKNFGMELLGSMFQAIGRQLHFNSEWAAQTRIINMGLTDHDALTERRGFGAIAEKYKEMLGDDDALQAVIRRTQGMPLVRAKELTGYAANRVTSALRIGLDTGIGVASDPEMSYPTVKLQSPFTWSNQLMHRAVARQWMNVTMDAVRKAGAYMKAHPSAASDPSFSFSAKEMEYSGRGLVGIPLDDTHFSYLNETLQRNGISLEEAGRRMARGEQALTDEQLHAIVSLAQSEILLNSSVITRPSWSITSPAGRIASPIVGWSLYKMVDLVKTTRSAKGTAELKAFKQAVLAFLLGVVPASVAYALVRDEYDEEILGKKANVIPLKADKTLPLALIDNLSRVGALGIGGDFINSVVNVSTSREFSLDSRIFLVSSLVNIKNVLSTIYNQEGTATYDTVYRPLLQSLGGSGYLSNFDAINNLLGFDNAERRVVRRINTNNQLRAIGRVMELDVRTGRGMQSIPNPVKPWISQMVLAAYSNDPVLFQRAYKKAVEAAAKKAIDDNTPEADPKADVAEAYSRMHPLRTVFGKAPTRAEYQKILVNLGPASEDVSAAIRNFNSYGAQIPRGRGKEGITPFFGTERSEKDSKRSVITADFGSSSDFRSLTTKF
jgi:hypothetical protein